MYCIRQRKNRTNYVIFLSVKLKEAACITLFIFSLPPGSKIDVKQIKRNIKEILKKFNSNHMPKSYE